MQSEPSVKPYGVFIQQKGGPWYAGLAEDDTVLWSDDPAQAVLFEDAGSAMSVARPLLDEGYQLFIYTLQAV